MAMNPITWLLLVAAIISIYLAGIILGRIAWSRNKPQPPKRSKNRSNIRQSFSRS